MGTYTSPCQLEMKYINKIHIITILFFAYLDYNYLGRCTYIKFAVITVKVIYLKIQKSMLVRAFIRNFECFTQVYISRVTMVMFSTVFKLYLQIFKKFGFIYLIKRHDNQLLIKWLNGVVTILNNLPKQLIKAFKAK